MTGDVRCMCGSRQKGYLRLGSWLALICDWCGLELHGIDLERLDEAQREEVLREVA